MRGLVREIELPDERAHEVGAREATELVEVAGLRQRRLAIDHQAQPRDGLEAAGEGRFLDADDDVAERGQRPRGDSVDGLYERTRRSRPV